MRNSQSLTLKYTFESLKTRKCCCLIYLLKISLRIPLSNILILISLSLTNATVNFFTLQTRIHGFRRFSSGPYNARLLLRYANISTNFSLLAKQRKLLQCVHVRKPLQKFFNLFSAVCTYANCI